MKQLLCIFLAALTLLLSVSCSGTGAEKEQNEYNAYGNILKEVEYENGVLRKKTEYVYDDSSQKISSHTVYEYDEQGFVTKVTKYYSGEMGTYSVYEYGDKHQLRKITEYYGDGYVYSEEVLENHPNGKVKVSKISSDSDGSYAINEYDDNWNNLRAIKQTSYSADGSCKGYVTWEFDKDGKETKYSKYNSDESLSFYCIYEYYDEGIEKSFTSYNADGSIREIRENNTKGDTIQYTQYDSDSSGSHKYTRQYAYDQFGNRIESLSFTDDVLTGRSVYEYDEKHNNTKETSYDADGNLKGYMVYEYDENGKMKSVTGYDQNGEQIYHYDY